ncbi:lipopolysaccharide biosynthesis glycosyltransferase [Caulobacter rhizosphaerae]|uniref:Lipopolysaccharide biosynthesis glycosyltransferase n=1 Tax=Caulobacter rhizosphaerae TaxID=2010972 RepID=A0ABU1N1E2_9CAUL|nr:glycosyltransferase family 8 protein [Caulobacter rhizosphaerae]MDR6532270.1 lipopolysaccharide biosynthesis glycosyltransferase [Caulobacter rhizosphaerae]
MKTAPNATSPPPAGRTPGEQARAADRTITVLFCCDPGYYQHLAVALVSLLLNNASNFLDVHLISSRRDSALESKLTASLGGNDNFRLRVHYWNNDQRLYTSHHITMETYTRLFAATILDDAIDKILYLDSDLIVVDDLMSLWRTDIRDYVLAAVPDPFGLWRRETLGMPREGPYVNAGVLLLNLARWRSEDLTRRLADFIAREGDNLVFHDQDAINAILHAATKVLPYRWNLQARMLRPRRLTSLADHAAIQRAAQSPAIIHYTSARKPWLFVAATPGKQLYRHYLRLTAWRTARPIGRSWSRLPEYLANHALDLLGSDYTWERVLRSTTVGRIIDRSARLLATGRAH